MKYPLVTHIKTHRGKQKQDVRIATREGERIIDVQCENKEMADELIELVRKANAYEEIRREPISLEQALQEEEERLNRRMEIQTVPLGEMFADLVQDDEFELAQEAHAENEKRYGLKTTEDVEAEIAAALHEARAFNEEYVDSSLQSLFHDTLNTIESAFQAMKEKNRQID